MTPTFSRAVYLSYNKFICDNFLRVYIDDMTLYTNDFAEHLNCLQKIFERTREVRFRLNPAKCMFFREEIKLLGFVVSNRGIHLDSEKIKKIFNFPIPKSKRDIRAFVNLAGFYRRHVHGFAEILAPIYEILKKTCKVNWNGKLTKLSKI